MESISTDAHFDPANNVPRQAFEAYLCTVFLLISSSCLISLVRGQSCRCAPISLFIQALRLGYQQISLDLMRKKCMPDRTAGFTPMHADSSLALEHLKHGEKHVHVLP